MNEVNALLEDDHSNVSLDIFMQQHQPLYSQIIYTYKYDKKREYLEVIHSLNDNVKIGDLVVAVNGGDAIKEVKRRMLRESKKTNATVFRLKRTAMLMSLLDPMDPVEHIEVRQKGGKIIPLQLQYKKAGSGLFGDRRKSIYQFIQENLINLFNTDERGLSVSVVPEASMVYLDMHECPSHGPELQQYIEQAESILNPQYEWVVIDLRNNLGGSLLPLFVLTSYLFDIGTARAFYRC